MFRPHSPPQLSKPHLAKKRYFLQSRSIRVLSHTHTPAKPLPCARATCVCVCGHLHFQVCCTRAFGNAFVRDCESDDHHHQSVVCAAPFGASVNFLATHTCTHDHVRNFVRFVALSAAFFFSPSQCRRTSGHHGRHGGRGVNFTPSRNCLSFYYYYYRLSIVSGDATIPADLYCRGIRKYSHHWRTAQRRRTRDDAIIICRRRVSLGRRPIRWKILTIRYRGSRRVTGIESTTRQC